MLVEKTEHALNEVKDQFNRPHAQREGNKSWAGQRGFLKKVVVEMGLEERVRWGGGSCLFIPQNSFHKYLLSTCVPASVFGIMNTMVNKIESL